MKGERTFAQKPFDGKIESRTRDVKLCRNINSNLDILHVRRVETTVVLPGEEVLRENVQNVRAEDAVLQDLSRLGVCELRMRGNDAIQPNAVVCI